MSRKRLVGSVAAAVAVIVSLAGCSLIPAALGLAGSPASTTPTVGACWNTSDANADNWADWEGAGSVNCDQAHDLYTYEIGKVVGVSAKSWGAPGDPSQVSAAIEAKVDDACDSSKLLPNLKWNQQLVSFFFFVPSESAWKNGARWVRCDVGVLAYGTTLSDEQLTKLPATISTLVSSVSSDPQAYDFCVNSAVPVSEAGPLDNSNAKIADCRNDPQWALTGRGNLPEIPGAAYPSSAKANAEASAICTKFVQSDSEVWIAYLPSKSDWTSTNDREVDCWIGQTSTSGGGSVT
jgi:hypothetical protein